MKKFFNFYLYHGNSFTLLIDKCPTCKIRTKIITSRIRLAIRFSKLLPRFVGNLFSELISRSQKYLPNTFIVPKSLTNFYTFTLYNSWIHFDQPQNHCLTLLIRAQRHTKKKLPSNIQLKAMKTYVHNLTLSVSKT